MAPSLEGVRERLARARLALSARLGRLQLMATVGAVASFLVVAPPLGAALEAGHDFDSAATDVVMLRSGDAGPLDGAGASVLMAPLYLRIPEPELLNSSLRGSIYSVVVQSPGLTFTEIRGQVGAASGTLQHHLRVLERGGALRRVRVGKYTRFYPATSRALRLSPPEERIARALAQLGPSTQATLGRMLGMSRQLVHYHVEHLEGRGVVAREWASGAPVVRLTVPISPANSR